MRFDATITYPASSERVSAMLADEEFIRRRLDAAGAHEPDTEVVHTGGAFTVSVRAKMPTDEVPARFRSLVGSALDVRLVEAWQELSPDGSRRGTISVDILGAPVRVTGTMVLAPGEAGSQQSVRGDITASVPLFGHAIEKTAASTVDSIMAGQREVALSYLSDHSQ